MRDAVSQLIDAFYGPYELLRIAPQIRKGSVDSVIPEIATTCVAAGQEVPPGTEGHLREQVGVKQGAAMPADRALGSFPSIPEVRIAQESPKQWRRIQEPIRRMSVTARRASLFAIPGAELNIDCVAHHDLDDVNRLVHRPGQPNVPLVQLKSIALIALGGAEKWREPGRRQVRLEQPIAGHLGRPTT